MLFISVIMHQAHSVSLLCDLDHFQSSVELKWFQYCTDWEDTKRFKGMLWASYNLIHCCCIIVPAINFYYLLSLYCSREIEADVALQRENKMGKKRNWQRTIINADDFRNPYDYHVWVLIIIYITFFSFCRCFYSLMSYSYLVLYRFGPSHGGGWRL